MENGGNREALSFIWWLLTLSSSSVIFPPTSLTVMNFVHCNLLWVLAPWAFSIHNRYPLRAWIHFPEFNLSRCLPLSSQTFFFKCLKKFNPFYNLIGLLLEGGGERWSKKFLSPWLFLSYYDFLGFSKLTRIFLSTKSDSLPLLLSFGKGLWRLMSVALGGWWVYVVCMYAHWPIEGGLRHCLWGNDHCDFSYNVSPLSLDLCLKALCPAYSRENHFSCKTIFPQGN